METAKLLVRGIPPRLKGKISRRAQSEKASINDVVVSLLCASRAIAYEPSGRPSSGEVGPYPNIVFTVPAALKDALDVEAATSGQSLRNVVVRELAEAFGEPFVETGRWVGREAAA